MDKKKNQVTISDKRKQECLDYEMKTTDVHKTGGMIFPVKMSNKELKSSLESKWEEKGEEMTKGSFLAYAAECLWCGCVRDLKDKEEFEDGEWVIFHIGQAADGSPIFRLAGYVGDMFADETEFDVVKLSEWGYSITDIIVANQACIAYREHMSKTA